MESEGIDFSTIATYAEIPYNSLKSSSYNGATVQWCRIRKYMKALDIEWSTSSPLWPQGDSNIDTFNKAITSRGEKLETSASKNFTLKLSVYSHIECSHHIVPRELNYG